VSVLAAILVSALVAVTVGIAGVGSVVVLRHGAQSAADLAALAGAAELAAGEPAACARAVALAQAMRVTVTDCRAQALDLVVAVAAPVRYGRWQGRPVRAAARAGPAQSADRVEHRA